MALLAWILGLLAFDAALPGEELGPPVTEESQPNEGEDLIEEPAPPPREDWGEDARSPDAASGPAQRRPALVDATSPPDAEIAASPVASDRHPEDRDGLLAMAIIVVICLIAALAAAVIFLRRRR